jgi:intracellular sulfur oxidation DsrE/DsrF family protein
MYRNSRFLLSILATFLLIFSGLAAHATSEFADAKYVLQISDNDPSKQQLVLNVASNLLKHYGQDQVAVEIVAFGPGLRLMFASNSSAPRIGSLSSSGVAFSACSNTLAKMTALRDGAAPAINPVAEVVPAGAVRIGDLVRQGYTLIKP